MTTTPVLGLTELVGGQAIPETSVNQFVRLLEQGALAFSVKDKDLTAPPGGPAEGDAYVIAAIPTGAWSGKAKNVAFLMNGGWIFIAPREGMQAWMQDEDLLYRYDGAAWGASGTGGLLAANNLSDVASPATARSNLSVYSIAQADSAIAAAVTGLLDFKGSTDCSANPNYPAALKGDTYIVSVAGKIGGAAGTSVDAGDAYVASADNAGGTQAAVGASWFSLEHNGIYGAGATAASTTEVLTGTDAAKLATPDAIAALWEQGADVASAGTVSLGEGGYFNITGTTTITDVDFGTDKAGRQAWVKFGGVLTLTHNASTLILPTGASIVTATGDTACFISEGADVVRCVAYTRANGGALAGRAPAIQSVTSAATVTPTFADDQVNITAQAAALALANPTGTAVDGWGIAVRIKDNATARAITYGTQYRALGVTLPTTTVVSKTLYLGMVFNAADTKWDVVAVAQEA